MVVCCARCWVRESFPLFFRGYDVDYDCRDYVVRGVIVYYEAMTYSAASVVATPDYWAVFAEDCLESFDDEVPYCAFVMFWWEG